MKFAICLLLTFQVFTLNAVYSQTEIRIDPSAAYGGAGSQIFENIHYIPLETNNESIFGAIDRLAVTKKYFVILDLSTNSILIFKRDGGFYTRISGGDVSSYKGRQANAINDFAIDRDSNKIVYNKGIGNIISYNIDQRKPTYYRIRVPGKKMTLDGASFFFDSITRVYVDYDVTSPRQDSVDYELKFVKKGHVYNRQFPYKWQSPQLPDDDIISLNAPSFYESSNQKVFLYVRPYNYKIYQIVPEGCQPLFSFIFPQAYSLPNDFLDNPKYHNNRVKFCKENPNIIHSISNAFLIKGNLFFRINRSGLSPGSPSYIYNLKSGKLIDVTRVVPDAGNGYLPIAADKIQTTDFENSNFLASDGESVFTAYSSQFMFSVKKATVGKSPKYDSVLKQYFTTGNSKSNPVIVQVKPKEFF